MYFEQFPLIPYDSAGDGISKDVTNIFRRVAVRAKVKTNTALFDTYDVKDGETPEMIADRLYDDSKLHWVILLFNEIHDRYHQWPMSTIQFEDYLNDKYGDNLSSIHHYEITQSSGPTTGNGPDDYSHKIEVNETESGAESVSNYEYERREQDKKRQIKLLDPRYLPMFLEEFERLIRR